RQLPPILKNQEYFRALAPLPPDRRLAILVARRPGDVPLLLPSLRPRMGVSLHRVRPCGLPPVRGRRSRVEHRVLPRVPPGRRGVMSARAMWKGVIVAGKERLGVKLYSALEDRNIHFHLLHDQDHVRIQQRMVHRETGRTVPYAESRRGVEVDSSTMVVLDDQDLESLEPEDSRDIRIERFIPTGTLTYQWYERPYYLGPDGDEAAYFALAEALAESQSEGIARWV